MRQRRVPMRMCNGCSEMKPKKELIRVVRSPQGEVSIDPTGKKSGRGAYICPKIDCLKKARKTKRIERQFQCQIPQEVYDRLEEELSSI